RSASGLRRLGSTGKREPAPVQSTSSRFERVGSRGGSTASARANAKESDNATAIYEAGINATAIKTTAIEPKFEWMGADRDGARSDLCVFGGRRGLVEWGARGHGGSEAGHESGGVLLRERSERYRGHAEQ